MIFQNMASYARDGLIPVNCTFRQICITNSVLVSKFGNIGRSVGTLIRYQKEVYRMMVVKWCDSGLFMQRRIGKVADSYSRNPWNRPCNAQEGGQGWANGPQWASLWPDFPGMFGTTGLRKGEWEGWLNWNVSWNVLHYIWSTHNISLQQINIRNMLFLYKWKLQ